MTPSRRSTMLLVYSGLVGASALRPSSPPSPKYGQLASKRTRPTAFRCNERSFHYKFCNERTFHYIQSIKDTWTSDAGREGTTCADVPGLSWPTASLNVLKASFKTLGSRADATLALPVNKSLKVAFTGWGVLDNARPCCNAANWAVRPISVPGSRRSSARA